MEGGLCFRLSSFVLGQPEALMPAQRRFGMDHEHYDWSPISARGILRWPDNARVALCVIVTLEHMEWRPPEGSYWVTSGLSPVI